MTDVIAGDPTAADLAAYAIRMIIHAIVVALASLIPLFCFGIWKRAVIPLVICAIFFMQFPNFLGLLCISLNPDLIYAILSLLGVASIYLFIKLIGKLRDL